MSISDLMVLRGRVGTNLTLHRSEEEGGRSFVRFRMVVPRARRKDSGQWEDGEPQWYTVRAWGPLADNMAVSLHKGNPLVVVGRPAAHAWINGEGEIRSEIAINAFTVGHDMGFGISMYRRLMPLRTDQEGPEVRITPARPAISEIEAEQAEVEDFETVEVDGDVTVAEEARENDEGGESRELSAA
ncbi:single-stranded DNA-binding protein [Actinomyces minihominis]|uniref:single-stranded DNA-binding protein n=1 Tax=Actinomyces minihominis TaxID=2002838 RepID=UPI000C076EEB|nr:single-stranded DNA-binding protein [Actinomyces minihominis]